jgi:hypothetical protein
VPKDLVVATEPEIRIQLAGNMQIRIVGKKDRVIARVKLTSNRLSVYGAREWRAQTWTWRQLQREGISPTDVK